MDNITIDAKVQKGIELFGVSLRDVDESLEYLIKGPDPWLKACAIYCTTKDSQETLRQLVVDSTRDPHPVVRETALLVTGK